MRKWHPFGWLLVCVLSLVAQQVSAQTKTIRGIVKDEKNTPLLGASVMVKNSTVATSTDSSGTFSLSVPSTASVLIITSVGFGSKEVVIGKNVFFNITLSTQASTLTDVVVVAYGQQKKASVTAAISTIDAREIVQSPVANISNGLAGRLPGLISVQSSGKPGEDASTLYIRGIGTYTGGTAPLIMVDGIVRDSYNDIDPNEVETISILKDASATAVFGVRGANGVVLITTKRGKEGTPKISATVQTAATSFTRLPKYVNSYQYATLRNEQVFETYWQQHANDAGVMGQPDGWAKLVAERNGNASGVPGYAAQYSDQDLLYFQNAHTPKQADGSNNPNYDPYFHPDVDWQKLLYKNYAPQTQANVNVTGGTRGLKYFLSAGYLTQRGMFKTDYMPFSKEMDYRKDRYNMRGNFDFDVNDNFKISMDLGTQFVQVSGMNNDGYNYEKNLMWTNPMGSPGYIDNKLVFIWGREAEQFNPLYSLSIRNDYNLINNSTLNSAIRLVHKLDFITKGLSVSARGSYDSYFSNTASGHYNPVKWTVRPNPNGDPLDPIWVQASNDEPATRNANAYNAKWRTWYTEFALNYNRSFGDHNVTGLVMGDLSKKFDPKLSYHLPHAYEGFVARVTYGYKGKYLAEFDAGYNGSENFPPQTRFGLFPAYSLGWVASNENFWWKNDLVSFLKIRGSLGLVGNDQLLINNNPVRYMYMPNVWGYGNGTLQGYYFGMYGNGRTKVQGAWENTLGNPDITWETAQKANVGFEARLLKDKISVTYDHYVENRKNILSYRGTMPGVVAAALPPYNIGKVKNWGNELEISYREKSNKRFNYWVKANVANNQNKILFMDEAILPGLEYQAQTGKPIGQNKYLQADGLYTSWAQLYAVDGNNNPILSQPVLAKNVSGQTYTNASGQPVYQKDLSFNGVPLQPGDIKLIDINEDGVIDYKDYEMSGKTKIPQFTYGLSLGFTYKGFDMSVLFQGAAGVAAQPMPSTDLHFNGTTEALFEVDWNRFTPDRYAAGQEIDFPMAAYNRQTYMNTFFRVSTSYVRLKNAEVGYTFQKGMLRRIGIASARVYVNGFNLHTWSANSIWGDPENMGFMGYPLTRVYNTGLSINF